MGSYANEDEVQALIPEFVISTSSSPSLDSVTALISQAEGEINGVLSAQGYESIPATGANDVALLQGYVTRKVAADVWLTAYQRSEPPYKVKAWREEWADFIARLRRGEQHLIDQLPQGDSTPSFAVVRHPTRDDYFTERAGQTDWDE